MKRRLAGLALGLLACAVETDLPAGAVLRCGARSACPADRICRDGLCAAATGETLPGFGGVRVLPLHPEPGETLTAWPTGFRPVEGVRVRFEAAWEDPDGRVLGAGWTYSPAGSVGVVSRVDLVEEDTGRVVASRRSCPRQVRPAVEGFVADRPRRARPDTVAHHDDEPAPRAWLDAPRERLLYLAAGGDGIADLWELDLAPVRVEAPRPPPEAREAHRWRRLLRATTHDLHTAVLATGPDGVTPAMFVWLADGAALEGERGCERELPAPWAKLPGGLAPAASVALDGDRWLAFGPAESGTGSGVYTRSADTEDAGWTRRDEGQGPPAVARFAFDPVSGDLRAVDAEGVWTLPRAASVWSFRSLAGTGMEPQAALVLPESGRLLVWSACVRNACAGTSAALSSVAPEEPEWRAEPTSGARLPMGRATLLADPEGARVVAVVLPFQGGPSVFELRPGTGGGFEVAALDARPEPLWTQGAAWDGARLAVFGGYTGRSDVPGSEQVIGNAAWFWEDGRWRLGDAGGGRTPPWRSSPLLMALGERRFLMYGGQLNEVDTSSELWWLEAGEPVRWTAISPAPEAVWPPPRGDAHGLPLPSVDGADRFWVFGGGDRGAARDDAYVLTVRGAEAQWAPEPGPTARSHAAVAVDVAAERMLVIGGTVVPFDDEAHALREVWVASTRDRAWRQVPYPEALGQVAGATLVTLAPDRYLLWGGGGHQGRMQILCWDADLDAIGRVVDLDPVDPGLGHCGHESATIVHDAPTDSLLFFAGQRELDCDAVTRYRLASALAARCD